MVERSQSEVIDAYEHLFAQEGWKMFIEDIKRNQESLAPQLLAMDSTSDQLWFFKGRNDVYTSILGMQGLVEAARQQLVEELRNEQADFI